MLESGFAAGGGDGAVPDRSDLRRRVLMLAIPALGEQALNFCVSLFDTWLAGQVSTGEHGVGVYTTTVGIAAYAGRARVVSPKRP